MDVCKHNTCYIFNLSGRKDELVVASCVFTILTNGRTSAQKEKMIWDRPSVNTPIQPAMQLATSRLANVSHWIRKDHNAKIGLAIAVPTLIILLSATPVSKMIAQTWKRVTGQNPSQKKPASKTHPQRRDRYSKNDTDSKLPELPPKKSYAAAAAAPPSVEPVSPLTPDDASISSENSSHKQKFKLGKNLKKRWQNSPFGHGSSESPFSP